MQKTAYLNHQIINPESGETITGGLLLDHDGTLLDFGAHINKDSIDNSDKIIQGDLDDCIAPGLVDMRCTVGEPGFEHKETLETASKAAARAGITHLTCLPDTDPAIDQPSLVSYLLQKSKSLNTVSLAPYACLTRGQKGLDLTEMGLLREAGAIAFTDANHPLQNSAVMARALTYAKQFDALIIQSPCDMALAGSGVMNSGALANELGLKTIPKEAEIIQLERDLRLVQMTGARYHASNISTKESVTLIRQAKDQGLNVTCDTAAFYVSMSENDIEDYRTFTKIQPPLRHEDDRISLMRAFEEGIIDALTSDHRPENQDTKRHPFEEASFGANGLETLFSLGIALQDESGCTLNQLFQWLSYKPAKILGLENAGRLKKGEKANLVRFSPTLGWKVQAQKLVSKSKNTPYDGKPMTGTVFETIANGKSIYKAEENHLKSVA